MKAYVAPVSAVLSMNMNENIAVSAFGDIANSYYLLDGKVMKSEYVYNGQSFVNEMLAYLATITDPNMYQSEIAAIAACTRH